MRLRVCMHVCESVCLHCGCGVFVCASGHVCIMIVGGCVGVCVCVVVCDCIVIVLRLYLPLAMFVR